MIKATEITKWVKIAVMLVVPAVTVLVDPGVLGMDGMTGAQQNMLAIFIFAALSWVFDLYPAWVTSVMVIALILLTGSDSAFVYYRDWTSPGQAIGEVIKSSRVLMCFGDPAIMLYIGGLVMALTASKIGLDAKLARAILYPFGTKPEKLLLGVMIGTGILSMFMSDTATTALMIGMMTPVFLKLGSDNNGKAAFAIAITFSSLIGGMATPIGTPPSMLAYNAINDPQGLNIHVSFLMWMAVMVPICFIMIFLGWRILLRLFPMSTPDIEVIFVNKASSRHELIIVIVTYAVTILLWLTEGLTGIKNSVAAMVPIVVLSVFGIFTADDLNKLPWAVLWMFAGGLALGYGMDSVGLSTYLIDMVPFGSMSPLLILVVSALICWGLSNFVSNTGTAALLIPILTAMANGMGSYLAPIGGGVTLIMGIAISASMAMTLPVSTPVNAIAFASGYVTQKQMARAGLCVGLLGLVLGYVVICLASPLL